jgi:hypothetical protein
VHGAGAAEPLAATEFGTRQRKLLAQGPEERHLGIGVDRDQLSIHGDLNHGSASLASLKEPETFD